MAWREESAWCSVLGARVQKVQKVQISAEVQCEEKESIKNRVSSIKNKHERGEKRKGKECKRVVSGQLSVVSGLEGGKCMVLGAKKWILDSAFGFGIGISGPGKNIWVCSI